MKKVFFFLFVAVAYTSCIQEDFVDDLVLSDPRLRIITGSALGQDTLFVRDTVKYEAEFTNAFGIVEEVDLNWSSSNPEVVSVNQEGEVIALAKGVANLVVAFGDVNVERLLIIRELERVEISVPTESVLIGDELSFTARYYNRTGILTEAAYDWYSSETSIATIDAEGKLIGIASGRTYVTASANEVFSDSILINVVRDTNSVASIDIDATSNSTELGETITFTAMVKNINGTILANHPVSWTSSAPAILSIDNDGLATGQSAGMADVTASADGIVSDPISIMVVDDENSVASIEIIDNPATIHVGESAQLSALVKNINGDILSGKTISWTSSMSGILTVDNNGLITGVSAGSSNVTAISEGILSPSVSVVVTQNTTTSRTGSFVGRGSYRVSGDVTVSTQSDGTIKVELESNFSTSSGPGLYVYLSNSTSGGLDIGKLKSTSGSQTYLPPANVTLSDYDYVLIWCKPFGVTFGQAKLN